MVTRVEQLEAAINDVLDQQLDDLCWMDIYTKLGILVGRVFDPKMLSPAQMLVQCERFVTSLHTGCPYATDKATEAVRDREAALALFKASDHKLEGETLTELVRSALARIDDDEEHRRDMRMEHAFD